MTPELRVILHSPKAGFRGALADVVLLLNDLEGDESEEAIVHLQDLREEVQDFEATLHDYVARAPDIVDWYFANLINGAYFELQSEAPDYYRQQLEQFPEHRVGYHRSAWSSRLGALCFASRRGWLLDRNLDIGAFFQETGQAYRADGFIEAELLSFNGRSFLLAEGMMVQFPEEQFVRSQFCAAIGQKDEDGLPIIDPSAASAAAAELYGGRLTAAGPVSARFTLSTKPAH